MKTLLLEIGTEELPLSIFPEILDQMEILFSKYLQQANLAWDKIKIMATPRRLTVMVTGLPEKQTGKEIEVIGPPYKIAFDHDGNPTKAAIGFAQKQGVSVSELTCIETPKGEYVGVKIKESDQPTEEILAKLLPNYILSLSFPKYMRWHEGKIRVMVMIKEKDIRQNRLALLTQIKELFLQLADLSKIPTCPTAGRPIFR